MDRVELILPETIPGGTPDHECLPYGRLRFPEMKRLLFNLIFLGLLLPVFSQSIYREKDLRFKHYQLKDGLPDNSIHALLQDRNGLLWIGTKNGLARYDGYRFEVIRASQEEAGLSGNYISSLFEDADGFIWIGTKGAGLNRYSPWDNNFLHFGQRYYHVTIPAIICNKRYKPGCRRGDLRKY